MHLQLYDVKQRGNLKKVDIKNYQPQVIITMQLLYRELVPPST